jgi:hypothetical protein
MNKISQLDPLFATSTVEEIKMFECLLFITTSFFLEVGNLQVRVQQGL